MTTFESKRDAWLVAVLWGAVLVCVWSGVQQFSTSAPLLARLATLGGLMAVAGFMLWVLYGTTYELMSGELLIRCGPFRLRVPLKEIRSVRPTRNPLSSPACSLDRLAIRWGPRRKRVMISPEEKSAFLRALQERCPQLESDGQGLAKRDER